MKKLFLTAIAIISMASFMYADNGCVTPINTHGNGSTSIEKAGPHTKEYQDMKKLVDKYEQAVKKATNCEELEDAALEFILDIFGLVDTEYAEDEQLTPEEDKEINNQIDRISQKVDQLEKQWNCPTEEDEEEDAKEVKVLSTEEWESLINEFDAIVSQMEKMQNLDLSKDENAEKLLKVVIPLQQISTTLDNSNTDNLTIKQTNRLEEINNRLITIATAMGLMNDDE